MAAKDIGVVVYNSPDLVPARLKKVGLVSASPSNRLALANATIYATPEAVPKNILALGAVQYSDISLVPKGIKALRTSGAEEWRLTFEDNFDGVALDTDKWSYYLPWGSQTNFDANGELQHYEIGNVVVSGGLLHLVAKQENVFISPRNYPYSSGCINTAAHFEQAYGKFEARVKTPNGKGFWPAFWMVWKGGSDGYGWWPWPCEIDVMEQDGGIPNSTQMNMHTGTGIHYATGPDQQAGPLDYVGPDWTADFHVYAVEWSQNLVICKIDGVERWRVTERVTDAPNYIILNLAVEGNFITDVDGTTPFPSEYQVDYVRVYEHV